MIVFGLGRYGRNIARELRNRNFNVMGVDFDPQVVRYWHRRDFPTLYGDVEDLELYQSLPLRQAR